MFCVLNNCLISGSLNRNWLVSDVSQKPMDAALKPNEGHNKGTVNSTASYSTFIRISSLEQRTKICQCLDYVLPP